MLAKRLVPCLDVDRGRVVKGRYTASATRRTMSITIGRASEDAVMSRKTSSSAPQAS